MKSFSNHRESTALIGRNGRFLCMLFMLSISYIFCSASYAIEADAQVKLISGIQNEQTHALAKEVVRAAYERIGYRVKFEFFPGIRSLELANRGETDGDIARIAGTEKEFPNLRPVPTPVIHFQGIAFTKSVVRDIRSWDDLKGLRVGLIRGIRYSTIEAKGLNCFFAEDMTHLFRLLENGRIEVAIAVLDAGRIEIHANFQGSGIHVTGAPLYSAPLFHYVHNKNEYLIQALDRTLQEMESMGEIPRIHEDAIKRLMK
jgi:polar amino acid transport system substrate-binding protein